jgi:succinyl-CoA synthetase alpha subunit
VLAAGIAIGGDTFPGSTLSDHCIRYQHIPQIKMIVVLGELGGRDEYSLVEALKAGKVRGWCDEDAAVDAVVLGWGEGGKVRWSVPGSTLAGCAPPPLGFRRDEARVGS